MGVQFLKRLTHKTALMEGERRILRQSIQSLLGFLSMSLAPSSVVAMMKCLTIAPRRLKGCRFSLELRSLLDLQVKQGLCCSLLPTNAADE